MSLISAAELAGRLGDKSLVLCDVRFYLMELARGRREYESVHLPGAVFVDLHTELASINATGGGRHPLPSVADFTGTLERKGITPESFVVAYDSAGGAFASRMWWMLRSIGHTQVAVLDGGYGGWVAAGLPVDGAVVHPMLSTYPSNADWSGIVDIEVVATTKTTLIDARSADRYTGSNEPIDPRAGHIPGAINISHTGNLLPDGHHKAAAELAGRFAGVGPTPIVYCGSGVTACHNLLAMSVAGISDAVLYPGSWSEWSSDELRPIAVGESPG